MKNVDPPILIYETQPAAIAARSLMFRYANTLVLTVKLGASAVNSRTA